jgi:diacylglycerol kinase family enzyme
VATAPIPVLINRGGGTALARAKTLEAEIVAAFEAAGLSIDLRLISGGGLQREVKALADRPLIAVGGGDGTIGSAAGVLIKAKSKATMAVLPLGTKNHLARELGLSMDLVEVVKAIAAGQTRAIDTGEVNGRVFVNNASIGFYPDMVREREKRGLPKWLANLPAAWTVLKRARHHRLRLRMDGESQSVRTPLLFVGNNRYELTRSQLGTRASLEDGLLSVYAVERRSAAGLIGFAARTVLGRTDIEGDYAAVGEVDRLSVDVHAGSVDVAVDGEVVRLRGPLVFQSCPKSLRVIVPAT